ncbi:MAG: carbohydrate-binding family 9-like protein [Phycisphaerae bacterium]|nr:carbohydrate-binding family 9-like protein [Phycisphaerae bacterium]
MNNRYAVKRCSQAVCIDADWNKSCWQTVEPLSVKVPNWQPAGSQPLPQTEVKVQYDDAHLYVIFRVSDYYVTALTTQTHGSVYKDSCVEFFFSPACGRPDSYFNIETNCCGVLLAQHHTGPRQNSRFLDIADCRQIQIAGTVSGPIRQEIAKPMTWIVEYAVPLEILLHYTAIDKPAPGVCWRGNFYKCADGCSRPHWISWLPIPSDIPDFHRPDCFGLLEFM